MVTKGKPKRNKAMLLFLFPVFMFIFVAGWIMVWIDSKKPDTKIPEKTGKRENITIGAIPLESLEVEAV
jgi:hypothetical protein